MGPADTTLLDMPPAYATGAATGTATTAATGTAVYTSPTLPPAATTLTSGVDEREGEGEPAFKGLPPAGCAGCFSGDPCAAPEPAVPLLPAPAAAAAPLVVPLALAPLLPLTTAAPTAVGWPADIGPPAPLCGMVVASAVMVGGPGSCLVTMPACACAMLCAMANALAPCMMGLMVLIMSAISGSMSTTVRGVASLAPLRSTQSTNDTSRSCLMAMNASRLAPSR
mmetsp:Transcript_25202/g.63985  ORF Transcript_25202/g.63985 Transcript_25202/m.63985 type:complete len:225 (-) Transcript_25202:1449-2123(-)